MEVERKFKARMREPVVTKLRTTVVHIFGRMTLDQDFEAAAESIKNLTRRPTDEELLELYALFKQATVGDVNTGKPGMLDLKGKAKWNQWNGKKGMSKEAAKEAYIAYANGLLDKYK